MVRTPVTRLRGTRERRRGARNCVTPALLPGRIDGSGPQLRRKGRSTCRGGNSRQDQLLNLLVVLYIQGHFRDRLSRLY
jgi:hypothetical protein